MERKTARLTLLIDPRKKKLFEEICAEQDLTPSQVVRRLIRTYVIENANGRKLPPGLADAPADRGERGERGDRSARAERGDKDRA